jgi:hypothetical protein
MDSPRTPPTSTLIVRGVELTIVDTRAAGLMAPRGRSMKTRAALATRNTDTQFPATRTA